MLPTKLVDFESVLVVPRDYVEKFFFFSPYSSPTFLSPYIFPVIVNTGYEIPE